MGRAAKGPAGDTRSCGLSGQADFKINIMTPEQFKTIRKNLGLSVKDMAKALGLAEERSVRRYEDGTREISGPIKLCIKYIQTYGVMPKD